MKIFSRSLSFVFTFFAALPLLKSSGQPQLAINAEKNKAFDDACLIKTFTMNGENIADCLEHCLKGCLCQSFQICGKTKCQLCSSHKEENSSLLHEDKECIYATYKIERKSQEVSGNQCDRGCSMWPNCCKQPGLCLNNGVCRPSTSISRKRFACECPPDFHGDRCEQPIKSCTDVYNYLSQMSGAYTVLDSNLMPYEVYCDFDLSIGIIWTLVQSHSFANATTGLKYIASFSALFKNHPLSEDRIEWRGYRLANERMKTILENVEFILFTCNYDKSLYLYATDFAQVNLQNFDGDLLDDTQSTQSSVVMIERGSIGGQYFQNCKTWMKQNKLEPLHIEMYKDYSGCSGFSPLQNSTLCNSYNYFGNYLLGFLCLDSSHRCLESSGSTTQIWFGHPLAV